MRHYLSSDVAANGVVAGVVRLGGGGGGGKGQRRGSSSCPDEIEWDHAGFELVLSRLDRIRVDPS